METVIVYLDDAARALEQLALLKCNRAGTAPAHWVLVGCAPRVTQRINKWVSHSAREKWRRQWAAKLFAAIEPALLHDRGRVTTLLAQGPLPQLTRKLLAQHGACRVVDARRLRLGQELEPVTARQAPDQVASKKVAGALDALGSAPALAAK